MDEPMHATPTADMELEQRLDAYARARLSIAPDAAARIRERVMHDARRNLGGPRTVSSLAFARAGAPGLNHPAARARLRRSGALLLAATLAIGVFGGAAAAAQPGGPLYGASVWVEMITLPGDPAQRAVAELRRLETRLGEIGRAARRGDRGAVAAAIGAYGAIADEALAGAGADATALDHLKLALDRHLSVLQAVAASAPQQASEAIQRNIDRAVQHNDATLEKIVARTPAPNAGGANQGAGGNQGGGANPGGAANPAGGNGSTATAEPPKTQKPDDPTGPAATPDPTKKPKPTPKPDPTPAEAAPTDHPGGGHGPGQSPPAGNNRP
jgi:hypothetical protein